MGNNLLEELGHFASNENFDPIAITQLYNNSSLQIENMEV
jgi:hypothetical protein